MNWIANLTWVLIMEYLQNAPFIAGFVLGLAGIKRGLAWWKGLLSMIAGSFACAAVISGTDWIKVMATTRTTSPPDLANALRIGCIFAVACGILLAYIVLTNRLKKPYVADLIFGVVVCVIVAVVEARNNPAFLVRLHALGFATSGSFLITLIRRSADAPSWRALLAWMGFITLVMSVLIVVFDYAPFVRR